jgi:hypothetical protein
MVISPQQWSTGESYNCTSAGSDPVSKLPQLICDVASHDAVRTQMSVENVRFSRRNKKRPTNYWTCQKDGDSVVCRN